LLGALDKKENRNKNKIKRKNLKQKREKVMAVNDEKL
jgi:hypothetical protein